MNGRRRVGHGLTYVESNRDELIPIFMDAMGVWHSTGEAVGWPRCSKCRVPEKVEHLIEGLCPICYFHGKDGKFWEQEDHPLFSVHNRGENYPWGQSA